MNGDVTLFNGAFMKATSIEKSYSLWAVATESSRLVFLGDNYWGFSLGDFMLMAGALALLSLAIITPFAERRGVTHA